MYGEGDTVGETGLTSEEAAALKRQGKANVIPSKSSQSVAAIVARNVFTYFNAIFALLAVLVIIAGSYKSLMFLPVIIANTVIGIVQQLRAKKVLDDLALLDVSEYIAIRDGQNVRVSSDDLVLGDLVLLEGGQQIPADAVVASGEAGVNESLLTGESDEVKKSVGDELMSGSFVVAGTLVARLVRVGLDSYASQLTSKAKEVKDRPSQMVADIEHIILVAGILVIPIGGLLYWEGAISTTSLDQQPCSSSRISFRWRWLCSRYSALLRTRFCQTRFRSYRDSTSACPRFS